MDDSDEDAPSASGPAAAAPQMPIGGMVRDPAGGQDQPVAHQVPPRADDRRDHRQRWSRSACCARARRRRARPPVVEGPVRVPRHGVRDRVRVDVDPHRAAGNRRGAGHLRPRGQAARAPGFHITLPFTTAYSMSTRTQNYTMSSLKGEGAAEATPTTRSRCSGQTAVRATSTRPCCTGVDPNKATDVYRTLGTNYATRSSGRRRATASARSFTQLHDGRRGHDDVATRSSPTSRTCMKAKIEPQGLHPPGLPAP